MENEKKFDYYDDKNSLSLYLKEINSIKLLTRDEENKLAHAARNGDELARERLISANLRFVVNVAKKFQNQGMSLDDLISEGNLGMIHAIERFNPDQGFHFISYAVWWIRQSIMKALGEKARAIRLPQNRANELVQIEKARKLLLSSTGKEPTTTDIAELVCLSPSLIETLLRSSRAMASINAPPKGASDGNSTLGEFISDSRYESPEQSLIHHELHDEINKILATLTPKEATIIEMRFGLNNQACLSLKEIGNHCHLTKERIRQIEKKAIQRLSVPAKKTNLDVFMT
jgi:RNA polymerase primary sigma factor